VHVTFRYMYLSCLTEVDGELLLVAYTPAWGEKG